jgi:hypothetical protein
MREYRQDINHNTQLNFDHYTEIIISLRWLSHKPDETHSYEYYMPPMFPKMWYAYHQ